MMRHLAMLAIMLIAATTPASSQNPFEHIWLNSDLPCEDRVARDKAVWIGRTEIAARNSLCRIVKTARTGARSWALTARCTEGGPQRNTIMYLTFDGDELIRREDKGALEALSRCETLPPEARQAIVQRHKFIACDGPGCRRTASAWDYLDTAIARATGTPGVDDAGHTCRSERGLRNGSAAHAACIRGQLAMPPLRIAANCTEGSTTVSGVPFKLTDAAREGALRSPEQPEFWERSGPHTMPSRSQITVMASWFHLLCPVASRDWNFAIPK